MRVVINMFMSLTKLSSKIRIFTIMMSVLVSTFSVNMFAQSTQDLSEKEPLDSSQEEAQQQSANKDSTQTVLRLEDTIRGNKEQPQVLTIVPWQLPIHQRISESKEWQMDVKKLPSIERNSFLRNLAVVKELKAKQQLKKPLSDTDNKD